MARAVAAGDAQPGSAASNCENECKSDSKSNASAAARPRALASSWGKHAGKCPFSMLWRVLETMLCPASAAATNPHCLSGLPQRPAAAQQSCRNPDRGDASRRR